MGVLGYSSVDLDTVLVGKKGDKLRWKRIAVAEERTGRFPILVDLRKPLGDVEDAVAYAWTAFTAPAANNPAPENIDSSAGTCTRGAIRNASDTVKMTLTRRGMTVSLAIGAARTNPETRSMGHHSRPTHMDTSAASRVKGCTRAPVS